MGNILSSIADHWVYEDTKVQPIIDSIPDGLLERRRVLWNIFWDRISRTLAIRNYCYHHLYPRYSHQEQHIAIIKLHIKQPQFDRLDSVFQGSQEVIRKWKTENGVNFLNADEEARVFTNVERRVSNATAHLKSLESL